MSDWLVYHNPGCSKCRGALEILREEGIECTLVEYLEQAPSRGDLERILALLPDPPGELVRKDKHFEELGLDAADYQTAEAVIDLLLEHPKLMQRPVVIRGERARIARSPEKVHELLED